MRSNAVRRGTAFVAVALLTGVTACASSEYRAYEAARADYEDCLAEYPAEPDRCGILKDAANRRYAEYEKAAQQRWGRDDE